MARMPFDRTASADERLASIDLSLRLIADILGRLEAHVIPPDEGADAARIARNEARLRKGASLGDLERKEKR